MAKARDSYWLRSASYAFFERFSLQVFGLGSFLILIRAYVDNKEAYGTWILFLTVTSLLEVARNGLIQNAKVKFLSAEHKKLHPQILTASLVLSLILTGIIIVLLIGLAAPLARLWKAPELSTMFYIYTLTSIALIPFSQINFLQQANLRFKAILLSNVARMGLFFLVVLSMFLLHKFGNGGEISLIHLAWAQLGCAVFGSLVAWLLARSSLHFSKTLNREWLGKLFHFGKYTFGTSISSMIYKSIDKMMLGGLLAADAVALMDPALRITNIMEIPTYSIAAVVYPQSARKMESEGIAGVRKLYEKSVGAILSLTIPFCILVLIIPDIFITLVAGSGYSGGMTTAILQVTILYSLFVPFGRQFGTTLDSIGKPRFSFYFVISGAVLNIIFNYFFILEFGVIGAAYGTLTTMIIKFIAQQIILYRLLGVKTSATLLNTPMFYRQAFQMIYRKIKPAV